MQNPSSYYPIFIKGNAVHALVVGGGVVAEGKIRSLHEAGARVTVVSPEITPGIADLAQMGAITHIRERYHSGSFPSSVHLVIAATNDSEVNLRVAREAMERGILVNVVDDPESGSVIMPSVMKRGALSVAVSTGGAAPALARKLRMEIEKNIPEGYSVLIDELAILRPRIKKLSAGNKKKFWGAVTAFDKGERPQTNEAIRRFARTLLEAREKAEGAESG